VGANHNISHQIHVLAIPANIRKYWKSGKEKRYKSDKKHGEGKKDKNFVVFLRNVTIENLKKVD